MRDHDHHPNGPMRPARLAGAVNTVLRVAVGAGLAVVGAYAVSRVRDRRGLEARMARIEAMMQELEKKQGGPATE